MRKCIDTFARPFVEFYSQKVYRFCKKTVREELKDAAMPKASESGSRAKSLILTCDQFILAEAEQVVTLHTAGNRELSILGSLYIEAVIYF